MCLFKYRIECYNEDKCRERIQQRIARPTINGKTLWRFNLYRRGLHFTECDKIIKGFYKDEDDDETKRGTPIRVYFRGKFVHEDDRLFFDVYIYPQIIGYLSLVFSFILTVMENIWLGTVIATLFLCIFSKGYADNMDKAYEQLQRVIQ